MKKKCGGILITVKKFLSSLLLRLKLVQWCGRNASSNIIEEFIANRVCKNLEKGGWGPDDTTPNWVTRCVFSF
jgi:hypothetical protein